MNDRTGEIRTMTDKEVAELNALANPKKDGLWFDVSKLSENERLKLQGMSRAARRAYFKKQRRTQ